MIQMGAGQEGQRTRIDIIGAKQTIDLMGVLAEKTKGNLTEAEDRTLQTGVVRDAHGVSRTHQHDLHAKHAAAPGASAREALDAG